MGKGRAEKEKKDDKVDAIVIGISSREISKGFCLLGAPVHVHHQNWMECRQTKRRRKEVRLRIDKDRAP